MKMGGVDPSDVIKTGHLLKQGHFLKNWKMRMFQLSKDKLMYGHLQKGLRGTIELKHIKHIHPLVDSHGRSVMFEIKTVNASGKSKDFLILAKDDKEREEWLHAIKKARDNSLALDGLELFHDIRGSSSRAFAALKNAIAKAKSDEVLFEMFGKLHHFFNSKHNTTSKMYRDQFNRQLTGLRAHVRASNPAAWTPRVEHHYNSIKEASGRDSADDYRGRRSTASPGNSKRLSSSASDSKVMTGPLARTPLAGPVKVSTPRIHDPASDAYRTLEMTRCLFMIFERHVARSLTTTTRRSNASYWNERARRSLAKYVVRYYGQYELLKEIGQGTFANVYRALKVDDRDDGGSSLYAVKRVDKRKLNADDIVALRTEVDIMLKLNHPNIVRLFETFESDAYFDLVMEYCPGGELFQRLVNRKSYPESEARILVRAICDAVAYCHRRNVVHRDLKPENILFADTSDDALIKIADFGFAQKVMTAGLATDCGSPWYVAPEILTGMRYASSVDMWSIGVITYILLCGYPPFRDDNQPRLFVKIREVQYEFDSPYWDEISPEAKHFVASLLQGDTKDRLTAAQALQHRWLAGSTHLDSQRGFDAAQEKLLDLVSLRSEAVRRGQLEKKGMWNREYRPREFLLHPKHGLIYTDNFTEKGRIALETVKGVSDYATRSHKERHDRSFVLETTDRKYILRAESVKVKSEWMRAIRDAAKFSKLIARAEKAIALGSYVQALELVDAARGVDGFRLNYVTATLWARIVERGGGGDDDASIEPLPGVPCGMYNALHFRQIHSGPITCLAATQRDDRPRWVLTGGQDKNVVLWDASTGEVLLQMKGHSVSVKAIAMSEIRTAVSGGADGTMRAWDLETGKCLWLSRRRDGHKEAIASVAISPDGEWAVSGSWDKLLTVWSMNQGRAVMRLMGHKLAITAVCISEDGRLAVSGGVDKRIMVWDLQQQKRLRQFRKHESGIRAMAMCDATGVVVSGDECGGVMVWDLATGDVRATLLRARERESKIAINDISVSCDGRVVAVASEDRVVRLFCLATFKEIATCGLDREDQEISALRFCGSGGLFVAAHENRSGIWAVDWRLRCGEKSFGSGGGDWGDGGKEVARDQRRRSRGGDRRSIPRASLSFEVSEATATTKEEKEDNDTGMNATTPPPPPVVPRRTKKKQ